LLGVTRIRKCDQPAIAVELGAQPFKPERLPTGARLSAVTSIAASRNSRPSSSISVRPPRTAAIFAVPIAVSLQGASATALHTSNAQAATAKAIARL
jgi:hypothetical protein